MKMAAMFFYGKDGNAGKRLQDENMKYIWKPPSLQGCQVSVSRLVPGVDILGFGWSI